jgi:glycine betaine catabolism B
MLRLKSVNFETQQFQNHDLNPTQTNNAEWMIGRSPTCDIVLGSPEVSRVHGRILYVEEAYHFIDVGSTSGSVLNGEHLQAESAYMLQIGDLLQVGETFIYVEAVEEPILPNDPPTVSMAIPGQGQWTNQDLWCRCDRIITETADVKTFCLVAESPILFNYRPGQFVTLQVEIDGKPVLRPYSISSSPSRPHHLTVTIKRVPRSGPDRPAGLVSNWMNDHFKVGDRLKLVGGPIGVFTCVPDLAEHKLPEKMLLISAGSGITPMMAMSRWVQDTLANSDIVFLHSARQPQDIVFRSELETMAAQMPNFRLAMTLTQSAGTAWMGMTGRISTAMLQLLVPDLITRSVFVCGPNAFMQHVRETLETMGFPMTQYQEESFGGAPVKAKPVNVGSNSSVAKPRVGVAATSVNPIADAISGLAAARETVSIPIVTATDLAITFKDSGHTASTDGSMTILEVAEESGVSLRSACRMGACGACKVQSCGSAVRYESNPAALSDADREAGQVLACVAYPIGPVEVHA